MKNTSFCTAICPVLHCKTHGFSTQYAAYCRPKCRVLQDKNLCFAAQFLQPSDLQNIIQKPIFCDFSRQTSHPCRAMAFLRGKQNAMCKQMCRYRCTMLQSAPAAKNRPTLLFCRARNELAIILLRGDNIFATLFYNYSNFAENAY